MEIETAWSIVKLESSLKKLIEDSENKSLKIKVFSDYWGNYDKTFSSYTNLRKIVSFLPLCKHIISVELEGLCLDLVGEDLKVITDLENINTLKISGAKFSAYALQGVLDQEEAVTKIKTSLKGFLEFVKNSNITDMNLSGIVPNPFCFNVIQEELTKALISKKTPFSGLDLSIKDSTIHNVFMPKEKELVYLLKAHATLASLGLSGNPISAKGLLEALQVSKVIKEIDLSYCNLFYQEDKINYRLVEGFADWAKNNKTLTYLNLAGNKLDDFAAEIVFSVLANPTLECLDLGGNFITDKGAKIIAAAMKENSTLTTLRIGYNGYMTSDGIKELIKMLKFNSSLKTIWLQNGDKINDDVLEELKNAIKENKTIKEINFTWTYPNERLSDFLKKVTQERDTALENHINVLADNLTIYNAEEIIKKLPEVDSLTVIYGYYGHSSVLKTKKQVLQKFIDVYTYKLFNTIEEAIDCKFYSKDKIKLYELAKDYVDYKYLAKLFQQFSSTDKEYKEKFFRACKKYLGIPIAAKEEESFEESAWPINEATVKSLCDLVISAKINYKLEEDELISDELSDIADSQKLDLNLLGEGYDILD